MNWTSIGKYASLFAGAAIAVLVMPMMGGKWPMGEDYPQAVGAGLIAMLGLKVPTPARKAQAVEPDLGD